MFIKAFASGGAGGSGRGQIVRPASQQRRGNETMGAYLRRTGQSALGGTAATRGRLVNVTPVRGR